MSRRLSAPSAGPRHFWNIPHSRKKYDSVVDLAPYNPLLFRISHRNSGSYYFEGEGVVANEHFSVDVGTGERRLDSTVEELCTRPLGRAPISADKLVEHVLYNKTNFVSIVVPISGDRCMHPGRVDAGVQTDPPEFSNQDVSIADGRSDVTNNNNTLTSLSASVDDSTINIDASWTEYDFGQTGPFEFFLLEPQDQMLLNISSLSDVGDFTVPFGNQSLEAQEQTLSRYPSLPDADDSTIPSGNQLLEAQYQMHLHYPNVPDVELSEMDHRLSDITEDIISASSTTHSSTFVAHEQSQLLPPSPLTELTDSNDAEDKEDAEDGNEERADELRNIPMKRMAN
ncbi:hypothetical protein A7U60_g3334 [Sanghuangporus baumii]|uniref:Uncharacterized protein n=1 Tax=Sanghuangporus baumii TaxID=108892 RepID=A0A9Q5ND87_SANBA|nr:hypothetical protein A7U60_g3334 [Sanghuangporus baumii]